MPREAGDPAPSFLSKVLKFGALPLTIVSLVLTLMSYGYLTGFLEAFHAHPEQLQLSPVDYLLRSYRPLFAGFTTLMEATSLTVLMDWSEQVWWQVWPAQVVVALLWVFAVYSAVNGFSVRKVWRRLSNFPRSWSRDARARLLAYSAPVASSAMFIASIVGAGLSLWSLATLALFCVFFIPATSVLGGAKEARQAVILPIACRSPAILKKRKVEGARCVRVVRDGKEVVRGRFVEQGQNRILLYRRLTDSLLSAPLDSSVVEEVDTE